MRIGVSSDPILPWQCWAGVTTGVIPALAISHSVSFGSAVLIAVATISTALAVLLYLAARTIQIERDINKALRKCAEDHEKAQGIKYRAVSKVVLEQRQDLDTRKGVIDDLMDRINDLEVIASKVGTQKALIESMHKRLENMNHLLQYGTERRSGTTLEDVYRLTGEAQVNEGVEPPTFKELEEQDDN